MFCVCFAILPICLSPNLTQLLWEDGVLFNRDTSLVNIFRNTFFKQQKDTVYHSRNQLSASSWQNTCKLLFILQVRRTASNRSRGAGISWVYASVGGLFVWIYVCVSSYPTGWVSWCCSKCHERRSTTAWYKKQLCPVRTLSIFCNLNFALNLYFWTRSKAALKVSSLGYLHGSLVSVKLSWTFKYNV